MTSHVCYCKISYSILRTQYSLIHSRYSNPTNMVWKYNIIKLIFLSYTKIVFSPTNYSKTTFLLIMGVLMETYNTPVNNGKRKHKVIGNKYIENENNQRMSER